LAEFIYPLDDDTAVLQAALRVRTHRAMASPDEQDAHTRHVGTAWRHQSDGIAGAVEAARWRRRGRYGRSKPQGLTFAIRP